MPPPVSRPVTPAPMSEILSLFDPLHQAPPKPPAQTQTPPASSAGSRDSMRTLGNRTARNLLNMHNSTAAPTPPVAQLIDLDDHLDVPAKEIEAQLMRTLDADLTPTQHLHAGSLLDELEKSKDGNGPEKRSLLGKAADFLKSLPDPVQALIAHKTESLMNEPGMQATLRELDDLQKQSQQLEDDHATPPPPAQPKPPATATPPSATTQPPHVPKQPAAQPAHSYKGSIHQQMGKLEALEQEQAEFAKNHDDMHSPSAKLKAKEIEMRMAMLMENILSMMKMVADINKRANQIATSAV